MEYRIQAELLQAIADYLKTQPFEEVWIIMQELAQLQPEEETNEEE